MEKAARFGYDWDQYQEEGKTNEDLFAEILASIRNEQTTEIVIANWEGAFESESAQPVLDWLVAHSAELANLESLRIGDMESEECELSWIEPGNFSALWSALPNLKHLIIQGSANLVLGDVCSASLESLEIICGGLSREVIHAVAKAQLPKLTKLNLYLGVEDYGFDGNAKDIEKLLSESNFPKLNHLGLCNSEIAEEVTALILDSKYAAHIETLDLSKSVFTDEAAQLIIAGAAKLSKIQFLDLNYHFISEAMQQKLRELPFRIDLDNPQEYDEEEHYYNTPMFTE